MGLSKVISTLIGLISIVALLITLVTKSHDPLSNDRLSSGYEATRPHIPFASASCSFPKHCRRRRETGRDKERERERQRERERDKERRKDTEQLMGFSRPVTAKNDARALRFLQRTSTCFRAFRPEAHSISSSWA